MGVAHQKAVDLLSCMRERLTPVTGVIARSCVLIGGVSWDDCCSGQLWTRVTRVYSTKDFPSEATGDFRCSDWRLAADISAGVLFCAPVVKTRGLQAEMPTCTSLEASALKVEEAMLAMWCAMIDCAQVWQTPAEGSASVQLGAVTPLGPDGGCIGAETSLTVTLGYCRLCDA